MMNRLVVTGAQGFIGKSCIDRLRRSKNFEIHAIRRADGVLEMDDGIIWHTLDLFKISRFEELIKAIKPKYMIHLAWKVETGLNLESDQNEEWYKLSKKLIRIFYKYGGQRLLVTGSCFEFQFEDRKMYSENSLLKPNNAYGRNKIRLLNFLKDLKDKKDISYVWARIFFTFGPNQKKTSLIPHVISCLNEDKVVETTDGNQVYDYLYIEDVASAIVMLLEGDYVGDVNVCSGKGIQLKSLIKKVAIHFDKVSNIKFGARSRPMNSPDYVVGDNKLLKNITSWTQEFDIDKSVWLTINRFK